MIKKLKIYLIVILSVFVINMPQAILAKSIEHHNKSPSELTTVDSGVKLYSEYYPNTSTKFKGTIIFINGSGTSMGEWGQNKKFFNCAKKTGSLFFYDRSGLGKSPPNFNYSAKNPITAKLISDQLSILLKKRHIPSPYLIVAHSYGSMYAGYFILKNPQLIKGVLLVDPVPRNFQFSETLLKPVNQGIIDAKKHSSRYMYDHYSGQDVEGSYEFLGFNRSKEQIKKLGAIDNNIPVVIISSTGMEYKVKPIIEDWYNTQKQWLNKNPHSKIFQVKSGHFIQIHRPHVVCKQLKNLVNEVTEK